MTLKVVIFDILSLLMVYVTIPIMKLFSVLKFYLHALKPLSPRTYKYYSNYYDKFYL